MMPISRRRSRTLISIVLAIPSDDDEQGHRGHARHPAEDEQVSQPLALDVIDDRPALHVERFDLV